MHHDQLCHALCWLLHVTIATATVAESFAQRLPAFWTRWSPADAAGQLVHVHTDNSFSCSSKREMKRYQELFPLLAVLLGLECQQLVIVAVQIPQALHPAQAHLPRVRRLRGSVSRGSWERSQSVLPSRPLDFCRPSTGWSLRTAALDS
eukprot:s1629_g34.t3